MFGMTSLPVKAWLGGTARGRPRQVTPVCSHPQWNPADPELWVPRADTGSGGGWWVDPQRPHLSSGQPAASPDRQPVGFSHAPRAALPGRSALFPALPGHGSATNRAPLPRRSSAVPRAPRPVLRLHCAGVEVPELGCSPAQGQVSGPFREPHVAEWSQGYLGSPSAQPGRWDAAWHMVTRARPGFGRAGPQGPGLLGVQGLQGRLTPRGGNSPSQVRDTRDTGTCARRGPWPGKARCPRCPRVSYSPQPSSHCPPFVWPLGATESGRCPWQEPWHLVQVCGVQTRGRASASGVGLGLGRLPEPPWTGQAPRPQGRAALWSPLARIGLPLSARPGSASFVTRAAQPPIRLVGPDQPRVCGFLAGYPLPSGALVQHPSGLQPSRAPPAHPPPLSSHTGQDSFRRAGLCVPGGPAPACAVDSLTLCFCSLPFCFG